MQVAVTPPALDERNWNRGGRGGGPVSKNE